MTRSRFELKGAHVLAMVVGFFLVVIGVDAAFTVLAVRSFPGEVSRTAYEDGLKYNAEIEARAAQAALGWTVEVQTGAPGEVTVRVTDAAGAPLEGLHVTGTLERPATAAGRSRALFRQIGPGVYRADARTPRGGWDLRLKARDARGREIRVERRLLWR
jgi:nitrogen fixation protein FixH